MQKTLRPPYGASDKIGYRFVEHIYNRPNMTEEQFIHGLESISSYAFGHIVYGDEEAKKLCEIIEDSLRTYKRFQKMLAKLEDIKIPLNAIEVIKETIGQEMAKPIELIGRQIEEYDFPCIQDKVNDRILMPRGLIIKEDEEKYMIADPHNATFVLRFPKDQQGKAEMPIVSGSAFYLDDFIDILVALLNLKYAYIRKSKEFQELQL